MIQKHLELSCNAHCANPNFSRQFLPRSQLVGDRGILHVIKHNFFVMILLLQQGAKKFVIEVVPRLITGELTNEAAA